MLDIPDFKAKFGIDAYLPHRDGLLYKYFSIERGIESVFKEAFYFATPPQLNDPFELSVDRITFEMTDENIWSLLKRTLPNNPSEQQRIFELSKQTRSNVPEVMRKQIQTMRDNCGICCFTSNPKNELMWAHYGQSDTGVVIGFNLPPFSPHMKDLFVMKVKYEKEKSFINYFDKPYTLFPIWAYVKNDRWNYEEEIRAVSMSHHGLLRYSIESVKEIHYGMRTSEEMIGRMESVMALKKYHAYQRFKINTDSNSYEYQSQTF